MNQKIKKSLAIALSPSVRKTAIKVALVVGTILVAINHGPAVISGEWTRYTALQIMLTYLVPYAVSTYSSVKAIAR